MLSDLQKKTAQAIVNVFETSQVLGDYGKVTLLPGDSGHLTYGRSQTTLASGNLFLLINAYCQAGDAAFGPALLGFLDRLEVGDLSLDHDFEFRRLLREAGDDPVMQVVQDQFFDRVYWKPAMNSAQNIGVETALGTATVYDSRIHGSWKLMRDRTNDKHGRLGQVQEQPWVGHYVQVRRDWLANHSMTILHKTVYRMDNLEKLINEQNWGLELPLTVHGVTITEDGLAAGPSVRVSAEIAEERLLKLRSPFMQGADVRELQEALSSAGVQLVPDGVFGPDTDKAVRTFQGTHDLTPDGIVGPASRSALGL